VAIAALMGLALRRTMLQMAFGALPRVGTGSPLLVTALAGRKLGSETVRLVTGVALAMTWVAGDGDQFGLFGVAVDAGAIGSGRCMRLMA
jgi:hypothetical protein